MNQQTDGIETDVTKPLDSIPKTTQRLIYYVLDMRHLFIVDGGIFMSKSNAIVYCKTLNTQFPDRLYRFNWQWNDANGRFEIEKLVEKRRRYEENSITT
jgi:hypothetical protein